MTSVCAIVYLYATGHSTLEGDTRTYEQFLYYKSVLPEFWGEFLCIFAQSFTESHNKDM